MSSVQETRASRSRALDLISVTSIVFPSFLVQIQVSLGMLFTNRENHVVDKLAIFEKVLAF
jgi:hypothetical protein